MALGVAYLRIVILRYGAADYKISDGNLRIVFTEHHYSFCKRAQPYWEQDTIREGGETIRESPDFEAGSVFDSIQINQLRDRSWPDAGTKP